MTSYHCSKCNKPVIVYNSEIFRICQPECSNATVIANAIINMAGIGGASI